MSIRYKFRMLNLRKINFIAQLSHATQFAITSTVANRHLSRLFNQTKSHLLHPIYRSLTIKNMYSFSAQKQLSQVDADYLKTLSDKAESYYAKQQFTKGRETLKISAELLLKNGIRNTDYARIMNNIGITYKIQRKFPEALEYLQKGIDVLNSIQGNFENEKAYAQGEIGQIHFVQKNYVQAEKLLKESTATLSKNKFETFQLSSLFGMLATIYKEQNQLEQAVQAFSQQLQLLQKIKGVSSKEVIYTLNQLGQCYANLGKYSEALVLFQRIIPISEAQGHANSLGHASNLINIALIYKIMNKKQQFFQHFQKGLTIAESINGKDHPDLIPLLERLGLQYYQSGHYSQALPLLLRYQSILTSSKQKENKILNLASVLSVIGSIHRNQQNCTQALKHYQQSLEIFQKHQDCSVYVANILNYMAETYNHLGDLPSSLHYALSSLEVFEKLNGQKSVKNVNLYMVIADTYRKMGKLVESEKFGILAKELQQDQEENSKK